MTTETIPVESHGTGVRWEACTGCRRLVYVPRLERNLGVCPECGRHARLGARARLEQLLDADSLVESAAPHRAVDVLAFADSRPYPDRLARARAAGGLDDAAVVGTGAIHGRPVSVVAMDFGFMGGSMGAAVGEMVAEAAERALADRIPLIAVTASGGARMQEGCVSLMQMAKTAQAFELLREEGGLSVCVLTDPTYGGVTASFATLGDILIGERNGMIGFAGPRVVRQATGRDLPAGFQTAEYLEEHGLLDRVEPRSSLRGRLGQILRLAAGRDDCAAAARGGAQEAAAAREDDADPRALSAWERLQLARDPQRPTTLDYIAHICDEFVELHGDRLHEDDGAIVAGLASLGGRGIVVIGHQKGRNLRERIQRNFGMAGPAGYRKALRLMRLAERLGLPVVTLVDTQGAHPGLEAERNGQAWAISESIAAMTRLGVPVVSAVVGEGGSGGALGIAAANRVLMLENACYSVISPESCSTILHGDPGHREESAEALRITPGELMRLGVADEVVPEPRGAAQAAPEAAARRLGAALAAAVDELRGRTPEELRSQRFHRFRRIGRVEGDAA